MDLTIKDAKVAYYAARYHTNDLVNKILKTYRDNDISDSHKKLKIGRYSAAVAIRNVKKLNPKSIKTALLSRTFDIVEKIIKVQNDRSLSDEEIRKKTIKYCLAIAIRRGAISFKGMKNEE